MGGGIIITNHPVYVNSFTKLENLRTTHDRATVSLPLVDPEPVLDEKLTVDTYAFPGCLLDGVPRPPDVPPRNPTMSRLNGRLASAPSADPTQDFEPSCLVRTPSGNVYIPSGTLSEF